MQDVSTAIESVMINLNEVSRRIDRSPSAVLDLRYIGRAESAEQAGVFDEVVIALDADKFCLLSIVNRSQSDKAYAKRALSQEAALYVRAYVHNAGLAD